MQSIPKLEFGKLYHIYNRGNNRENLFLEKRNYAYFLKLYVKYISIIAKTFAYCLMPNHFHLLVRIREEREIIQKVEHSEQKNYDVTQQFSNFFNSYARSMNNTYGRSGALFKRPFGRKLITSDEYLLQLVWYIHFNPQKHRFTRNFRKYEHSSYQAILSNVQTFVSRDEVLSWFDGRDSFAEFHDGIASEQSIQHLIEEDS